ncbi:DUF6283 family protein [Nocardia thailandica]
MGPPAPRPCASCPYRRDVPSGVWAWEEYDKLRRYDGDMADQPTVLFLCHLTDPDTVSRRLCAGWVGCHGGRDLLAVRLVLVCGQMSTSTFETVESYVSPQPLFGSGAEAADHGQRDITDPGAAARRAISKLARSRTDRGRAPRG